MNGPTLSVVICTYNRCENLDACVGTLERQTGTESFEWELVVVDNNSTDDTAERVKAIIARSPLTVRYAFEPEQGLSHARNRGIVETDSDIVAFIDDDIAPEPQWLASLFAAFRDRGADAVGGPIHVEGLDAMPNWITEEMYGFLGVRDFGGGGFWMDGRKRFPFGGNMAFSRDLLNEVGFFDTRRGRKGEGAKRDELYKGEESDYFERAAANRARIWYEPSAAVWHKVLPHQVSKGFFRVLHFNAGLLNARLDPKDYPRTLLGAPWFVYRQTLAAGWRYLKQLFSKGPDVAFRQQMTVGYFLGMLLGYVRRRRGQAAGLADRSG